MSLGRASKVNIIGSSGQLVNVSDGNALKVDDSCRRLYPLGKLTLSNTVPTVLQNVSCSAVFIRNLEGNGNVYFGGSNQFIVQPGGFMPVIYETELIAIGVNNANEISLIADVNHTQVVVYVLSNVDQNPTISNPPPPDNTPPVVSSSFPSGSSVQLNSAIYLQFGEEMDPTTVNTTNITVLPSISYTVTKDSVIPSKVLIIPSANLANSTTYTITASTALADLDGNFMASPYSFSFTTVAAPPPPDTTPPTVVSTTPSNNTTGVSLSILPTISFSEAVKSSTLTTTTNIKLFSDANNTAIGIASIKQSTDQKTATLTTSGLAYGTKYRLEVSNVQDLAGNAMSAKYTSYFTTAIQSPQVLFQSAGDTVVSMSGSGYSVVSAYVNTVKSFLYNHKLYNITFNAYKTGNPTGQLSVKILDANGNTVFTFENTLDVSTLTTTSTQYTVSSTLNNIVMNIGYQIALVYNGGDSNNYVNVLYTGSTSYNSPDTFLKISIIGFVIDYNSSQLGAIIQGV